MFYYIMDLNKMKKEELINLISKMKKKELIELLNFKFGGSIIKKNLQYDQEKAKKIQKNIMPNDSQYNEI